MHYRTIGDVKVKRKTEFGPTNPQLGDTYYDEDAGAFFIYYGSGAGWLQVSSEDLELRDGC